MNYSLFILINFLLLHLVKSNEICKAVCPFENTEMECAFDLKAKVYKMFPSKCALAAYTECHKVVLIKAPITYCLRSHFYNTRRMYGESCPVFCPNHYRPVCGASKLRDYIYRTFNNGCYLDMINCRGEEDYSGYVEVPLQFCQKHLMKNIFKEQVVSNFHDYGDYN